MLSFLAKFVIIDIENITLRRESLMKTAILTSTILFLTMNLSAGTSMTCKNGVCIIDLSHLSNNSDKKIKTREKEKNLFIVVEDKDKTQNDNQSDIIVLPHEKYIMPFAKLEEYEPNSIQLTMPDENINHKIIKKTTLPTSDYFCENHKKVVYHQETDSFECS